MVNRALIHFNKGERMYITNKSVVSPRYENNYGIDAADVEKGEEKFREMLSNQIHELLGHKPRISVEADGYAIHYS